MYCFVRAISRNSRVTALLSVSSTLESRLISPESVSISFSERLLKILADTSAPRLVRKMAAFLVPDSVSTSGDIGAASRGAGAHPPRGAARRGGGAPPKKQKDEPADEEEQGPPRRGQDGHAQR